MFTGAAGLMASVVLVAIKAVLNPDVAIFEPQTPGTNRHRGKRSGSSLMSREALPYVSKPAGREGVSELVERAAPSQRISRHAPRCTTAGTLTESPTQKKI